MPKSEERRFKVEEPVMARWPRSNLYFAGTVVDYNDIEYLVRFDDDEMSELAIRYKDVEAPFSSRSSRSGSRGRASPSRKSPARKSPGRKSPGRKSPPRRKSPSRKSPGRKSPSRTSPAKRPPGRPPAPKKGELFPSEPVLGVSSRSALRSTEETTTTAAATATTMTTTTTVPAVEKVMSAKDSSPILRNRAQMTVLSASTSSSRSTTNITTSNRHSAGIAATLEEKLTLSDGKINSIKVDSIKVDTTKVVQSMEQRSRLWEFLKRSILCVWVTFKALPVPALIFILPFILALLCTAKKCNIHWPNLPQKIPSLLEKKPLAMAGGYLFSLLVLALIPVGKVVHTEGGSKIRCNAYVSMVTITVAVGVLLKTDFSLASVYLFYRHFLLLFTAVGIIISVLLYVKSFWSPRERLNPSGSTGYYLVDFLQGREINPRIGSFDLKFFLFRVGIISMIFLNLLIVAKDLQGKPGQYSPTLLLVAGMQIFYSLDFLLFEDSFLSTYEYTTQGMGFMTCILYLNFAFVTTTISKFILNHGPELIWYYLVCIGAMNLVGYVILRGANSQKHAFRTNPADPALAHVESLPTSTRKRLLVSGWWGLVRHPNYLGEIIVQLSWSLTCGFSHSIPWVLLALNTLHLLGRIFVVEKGCRAKYGLAWSSYTARVPYRLLPKVF